MTMLQTLEKDRQALFAPRKRPNPLEWAEREIVIDPRFSPRPGRFSCDFTPYLKQLHLWFGDRRIRQITFVKSAQIGGTTLMANLIQYAVAEDPGPILYVTSTADNAKSWSERELLPRMKACAAIQKLMPDDPDDLKKSEYSFKTCTVKLTGSNSANQLASRPIRYLFADETDKWPDASATEAPSLELAMARTNFYRTISKRVLASTPTVEGGAIWSQFLQGSQHRYHVACPSCGEWQHLEFDQVKWSDELRGADGSWDLDAVAESACYQCRECGDLWDQDLQRELVGAGRWIAGNPHAPADHISCHVNCLYSPQMTWGETAKLFLQKANSPGGLHDFRNTYEGLPFENRAASVKEDAILDLRADFRLREIPIESAADGSPVILTLCADPGEKQTHWSVEARNDQGESWVVDYGTVLSVEDLISSEFLAARRYQLPGNDEIAQPVAGLIDSGFLTERVYSVCAKSRGLYYPSKGSDSTFGNYAVTSIKGLNILLYTYGDFAWKTHLYLERIKKKLPPQLHLPSDIGRDFIEGLTGQQMLENKNSRVAPFYWKKVSQDHYGDCTKLHCVAWAVLRNNFGRRGGASSESDPAAVAPSATL
jgi:phage terminase large subunit GpA-like protein